ncbi:MAG TPA: L-histidine N(alpha)-methyltransferase, partial [Phenylobacterium sp.]
VWNDADSRIEMHVMSLKDQTVHVAGREFHFATGETLHTENSHKFTLPAFTELAASAGWTVEQEWSSAGPAFGMVLLRA